MSDWNMGYNTDILYTASYYHELNPLNAQFAFLCRGYDFPPINENMTCCELGFGMGLSLLINSAAGPAWWAGTDFAPNQALHAKSLAKDANLTALVCDDAFDQFLAREDLPQFDFIVLHGIWSWIDPMFQDQILDFIKKRIKVGGVVYISYNASPGFLTMEPARHLMHEYANFLGLGVDREQQMEIIRDFFKRLEQVAPVYYGYSPTVGPRVQKALEKSAHYLIHEYFNDAWHVDNRNDIVDKMRQAKLSYITGSFAQEVVQNESMSPKSKALLKKVSGTPVEQPLTNMMRNLQFMRDYYCCGPRQLSSLEQQERFEQCHFLSLVGEVKDGQECFSRYGIKTAINHNQYLVLDYLKDFKPHSFVEIREALSDHGFANASLILLLMVLLDLTLITLVVPPEQISQESRERCAKLNDLLVDGKYDNKVNYLASPAVQGGVHLYSEDLYMIKAYLKLGARDEESLLRLFKDESVYDDANMAPMSQEEEQVMYEIVHDFCCKIPLYQSLGII